MISAKSYIKKFTTVPESFIDELFEFYNTENAVLQTDFVIKLSVVAKWLNARKDHLVETLKKSYKNGIDYNVIKPVDFVRKNSHVNHYKEYMLTPDCFTPRKISNADSNYFL